MPVLQGNIIIEDFSTNILKLTSENPVGFFNDYYLIKNGTRIVISNDPALTGWYTLIAHTGVTYQFWYGQVTSPVTIDGDQFEYILENWVYDTSKVQKNNTYVAQNQTLNFIEGANITLTITDDYPNKRTNIQIDASGGGGGVTTFSAGTTGLTPVAATAGAIVLGGVLVVANGGTGLSTVPANGQLLIGNGTGYTLSTLTAGPGISITNGIGTITINNTGTIDDPFPKILMLMGG